MERFEATHNTKTRASMIFCGKETEKVLGKKLDDASIFPISLVIERARCYKLTVLAADLDKQ